MKRYRLKTKSRLEDMEEEFFVQQFRLTSGLKYEYKKARRPRDGPLWWWCGGLELHHGEQSHMQNHQVVGLGNCKLIQ